MRFDAHVGQHSAKNDLVDLPLAQLQNQVVGLWAPDLVRSDDDSFAVLYVWPETLQPISAGPSKTIEIEDSFPGEKTGGRLIGFEWSVELPPLVGRIEIVRRDENFKALHLRYLEDALHVQNGVVFFKAFADQGPRQPCFTQHLVLRVNEHHCRVATIDLHRASLGLTLTIGFWFSVPLLRQVRDPVRTQVLRNAHQIGTDCSSKRRAHPRVP